MRPSYLIAVSLAASIALAPALAVAADANAKAAQTPMIAPAAPAAPGQTYESGVAGLLASVKSDVAGASAQDAGRKAGLALMKRCTGLGD